MTEKAHQEEHRLQVRNGIGWEWRMAMIPGGIRLAKRFIGSCMSCRLRKRDLNKQMSYLGMVFASLATKMVTILACTI